MRRSARVVTSRECFTETDLIAGVRECGPRVRVGASTDAHHRASRGVGTAVREYLKGVVRQSRDTPVIRMLSVTLNTFCIYNRCRISRCEATRLYHATAGIAGCEGNFIDCISSATTVDCRRRQRQYGVRYGEVNSQMALGTRT